MIPGTYSTWIPYGNSMESIWKKKGIGLLNVFHDFPWFLPMSLTKILWLLCCLPEQYTLWHLILENLPLTFRQIAKYVWFFLYQSIPKRSQWTYFEKVIDVCIFALLSDLSVHVLSILGGFTQGHMILLYVDDICLRLESTLRTFYRVWKGTCSLQTRPLMPTDVTDYFSCI